MRSKNLIAAVVAACGVTVVACSSVSPTQACTDFANAVCTKASQCANTPLTEIYGDVAACTARATSACEAALALKNTADTADFVEKCSQAYTTLTCADAGDNNPPPACKRNVFGKLTDGSVCGTDGQCASGNCQIDATGCGTCIEPVAAGQACKSNSDCQSGLVCALQSQGNATCVAPVGAGQTCSTALPIVPCQAGLICSQTKCVEPLAAGSACNPQASLCDGANGYYCNGKQTRCVLATFAAQGQPCGIDVTTGNVTGCSAGGAGGGVLGACENIDSKTLQGTCAAAAADGASCDNTNGPFCTPPALCISGACTIVDPSTCH